MHRFSYTNFTKTMHSKTFYSIIKKLNRNKHHKKTTSRRKADQKDWFKTGYFGEGQNRKKPCIRYERKVSLWH